MEEYHMKKDVLLYCVEDPIDLGQEQIYGAKCSGCNSCGGGCYGCKVTEDMLEAKLDK